MTRDIKETPVRLTNDFSPLSDDINAWFVAQVAGNPDSFCLLAHADDGVIWGWLEGGRLHTAPQNITPNYLNVSPHLQLKTLQNARLFNDRCEIHVWRIGDGGYRALGIEDGVGNPTRYFDEDQILWGDHVENAQDGFAWLADGAQGLRHIVPLPLEKGSWTEKRLRLTIRHYLDEDDNGFVRVAHSRLVRLFIN